LRPNVSRGILRRKTTNWTPMDNMIRQQCCRNVELTEAKNAGWARIDLEILKILSR
jgi:hypothetical protein